MERIHGVDKKPWICQTKCNLKDLIRHRGQKLEEHQISLATTDQEQSEEFKSLSHELETFIKDGEKQVKPYFLYNVSDERVLIDEPKCPLKSYKLHLEHAKLMISDRAYKVNYLSRLKTTRKELLMRHLALHNRQATANSSNPCSGATMGEIDSNLAAVLVIQIWPQPNKHEKIRLEKEVLFRHDQCLVELRDHFRCHRDYGVPIDLSENPEQHTDRVFRGELFKSGSFLIEDKFYNDMRDINNEDLSARIIEWASDEVKTVNNEGRNIVVTRGVGPFQRARMEDTRFEDIEFRLGYPYLYLHQGNCEHLFTISDVRYVANDDELRQTKFPFVTATSIGRKDSLRCYMCRNRPPHWYTRNNNRLPVDPFFFCENCFYSFNYDCDKKKVGSFQAYLYTSAFGVPDSIVVNANKTLAQQIGSAR